MTAESFSISDVACDVSCCHRICDDNGRLEISKITEGIVEHLIDSEQKFRHRSTTQELYRFIRQNYHDIIPEDVIQRQIMIAHGIQPPISDAELRTYRLEISKFTHLPHIRAKGFFLKNNIMVEGVCTIGSPIPANLILYKYNEDHNLQDKTTLSWWMNKAEFERKTLVIFTGSIT
jgi:hypothetical protein